MRRTRTDEPGAADEADTGGHGPRGRAQAHTDRRSRTRAGIRRTNRNCGQQSGAASPPRSGRQKMHARNSKSFHAAAKARPPSCRTRGAAGITRAAMRPAHRRSAARASRPLRHKAARLPKSRRNPQRTGTHSIECWPALPERDGSFETPRFSTCFGSFLGERSDAAPRRKAGGKCRIYAILNLSTPSQRDGPLRSRAALQPTPAPPQGPHAAGQPSSFAAKPPAAAHCRSAAAKRSVPKRTLTSAGPPFQRGMEKMKNCANWFFCGF